MVPLTWNWLAFRQQERGFPGGTPKGGLTHGPPDSATHHSPVPRRTVPLHQVGTRRPHCGSERRQQIARCGHGDRSVGVYGGKRTRWARRDEGWEGRDDSGGPGQESLGGPVAWLTRGHRRWGTNQRAGLGRASGAQRDIGRAENEATSTGSLRSCAGVSCGRWTAGAADQSVLSRVGAVEAAAADPAARAGLVELRGQGVPFVSQCPQLIFAPGDVALRLPPQSKALRAKPKRRHGHPTPQKEPIDKPGASCQNPRYRDRDCLK
jgi:hypothetical protein